MVIDQPSEISYSTNEYKGSMYVMTSETDAVLDIKYIGNFRGKRFGREHILRSHFSFIFCNKTGIRPINIHELFISECFFANG